MLRRPGPVSINASQDPDAKVEAVLIPEKDLLDPEWTPKFDDDSSTEDEGAVGWTILYKQYHPVPPRFTVALDQARPAKFRGASAN